MGWREDTKFGIARIGRLFTGELNGGLGTEVTATAAELNTLDESGNLISEFGAGVAGAVQDYRFTQNGLITTRIFVDLDGLACAGTAQGTAIGLDGIDGCYIGRFVLANYGMVYQINMACLETPTQETATFEQDVDLSYTTAADVKAGEDVDVDIITAAHDWVYGEVLKTIVPKLTPDGDYIYLTTGDTAGDTGEYAGGQFMIEFLGAALI
jgi:hypothetical protein